MMFSFLLLVSFFSRPRRRRRRGAGKRPARHSRRLGGGSSAADRQGTGRPAVDPERRLRPFQHQTKRRAPSRPCSRARLHGRAARDQRQPARVRRACVPGATRTLLLYSHYDGQPVDPKAWKQADPFIPVLRTGRVDRGGTEVPASRGRSASTPSGGSMRARPPTTSRRSSRLCAAIDALAASSLRPAWNVRVILDGEEEASSPSLVPAIAKYREKLRADAMVILDGPFTRAGVRRSSTARGESSR